MINEAERIILSSNHRFQFLVLGSVLCSAAHTLLQERLYRDSFPAPHGWLTFLTFLVYSTMGFLESALRKGEIFSAQLDRLPVYAGVAALVVITTYITNVALHQVPYSIKIVVKSCRILPTMLLSVTLQGAQYTFQQICAALVLVLGLGLFLAADSSSPVAYYHPFAALGVLMLIFSVLLDAIIMNIEEKFFFRTVPAALHTEVMGYVSGFAGLYCVVPLMFNGAEGTSVWKHSATIPSGTWLTITLSAAAGYGAMSFMLLLIEHCGVATAEIVKNLRKVVQVGFSFLLFPKAVSWMHVVGGALVVGSMCLFMRRPTGEEAQKVRQSPKVVDTVSKEAVSFHELKPADTEIRAFQPGEFLPA